MPFIKQVSALMTLFFISTITTSAQKIQKFKDSTVIKSANYNIILNHQNGFVSYRFLDGTSLNNTTAFLREVTQGELYTNHLEKHEVVINQKGNIFDVVFLHKNKDIVLSQIIRLYKGKNEILLSFTVRSTNGAMLSTNYISPLAVLPENKGYVYIPGNESRILDVPFDNDNWVKFLATGWRDSNLPSGTSYGFTSFYDYKNLSGLVAGTIDHDFWKTGFQYKGSKQKGVLDSFIIYGGAATQDNRKLLSEYGGLDGTHDVVAHGSMNGTTLQSPTIFLNVEKQRQTAFQNYALANIERNGKLSWKGKPPFYWNSFGVEGVLGHEQRMMPKDVPSISDKLKSLSNFSSQSNVVLSIDSYDQTIYNTEILKGIGKYANEAGQEIGFYFIPFAVWTWKSSIETETLQHTNTPLKQVTLKDSNNQTIIYKNGDFGAFPIDPTHPATRERIIGELLKAKAINVKFLKIDFLTAGTLESTTRFNPDIHTGMQAYNYGMKMMKGLIDSILGPDIFIYHATAPMFPYQYAHTQFLSTDIYSHLRDDLPGFPHWGSTASSMITASHMGWTQGSLWQYTNMDFMVMKNFQKNPDIDETDVRTRLITMIVMGSLLGDGSNLNDSIAFGRANKYLNNKHVVDFFLKPKAFTPLRVADGLSQDQQLSFYSTGERTLMAAINFDLNKDFTETFSRALLGLKNKDYKILDFFTDEAIAIWKKDKTEFHLKTAKRNATLFKLQPIN